MTAKVRTPLVVILSSLIISGVLTLTIFGFYAYLEWKEKDIRRSYRHALYDLNAKLFERYLSVNATPKLDSEGKFKGKPIVSGTIRNNSNKTIYSLKLKIAFSGEGGQILYEDVFFPIGIDFELVLDIRDIGKDTKNFLLEGDSVSFKHFLANLPPEIFDSLNAKTKFAKSEGQKPIKFEYKVEGLDIR